jgi:hypothetical protein
MPRKSQKFLFAAVLFLATSISLTIMIETPSFRECQSNSHREQSFSDIALNNVLCGGRFIDKHNGLVSAFATVWIAIFTLVLVSVTNRQAKLTQASVELGRQEFISTHRPKIRIKHLRLIDDTIQPDVPIRVTLDFVNIGGVDAILDHLSFYMGIMDTLPRNPPHLGKDIELKGKRTQSGMTQPVNIPGEKFSAEDVDSILTGQRTLYCTGLVIYNDSVGNPRTTAFYRFFNPSTMRFFLPNLPKGPDTDYEFED